jgi:dihydropteroate synthase
MPDPAAPAPVILSCGARTVDLSSPLVMGIVNVTPDSFSEGGQHFTAEVAIAHGLRLVEEGAAILDVGGESTRPGAAPVALEEELRRVLPVIEGLRGATPAVISVDTSKPEVMRAAVAAGAGLINDIRALSLPGALETVAHSTAAVCLMHMQGEPRTMQHAPVYGDVVAEVRGFLEGRVAACRAAGIDAARICVDPGFGFGKTVQHNLTLLAHLPELAALRVPLLAGLSRKSLLKALTGRRVDARVHGSVALAVLAVLGGARIVRVHDVGATVDALKVTAAVRAAGGAHHENN